MSIEEQLKSFREYSKYAAFKYNSNGADRWVCPVCGYSQAVNYIQPGVKEPNPMTEDLENHDFNCPWNKNNLCQN